jgi:hypothetical protein
MKKLFILASCVLALSACEDGDANIKVKAGDTEVTAESVKVDIGKKGIEIGGPEGTIKIGEGGKVEVKGKDGVVEVSGDNVKVEGPDGKVEVKGVDVNIDADGAKVDVKTE